MEFLEKRLYIKRTRTGKIEDSLEGCIGIAVVVGVLDSSGLVGGDGGSKRVQGSCGLIMMRARARMSRKREGWLGVMVMPRQEGLVMLRSQGQGGKFILGLSSSDGKEPLLASHSVAFVSFDMVGFLLGLLLCMYVCSIV
jgi:hypothetical protein